MLFVNADDFVLEKSVIDRVLECNHQGMVHPAIAMNYNKDSERNRELVLENSLPTGSRAIIWLVFTKHRNYVGVFEDNSLFYL